MTRTEKHIAQTFAINQQLSNKGSKRRVIPERINDGDTVYASCIQWPSKFEMLADRGRRTRKKVSVATSWNTKSNRLGVTATCPQAGILINLQSDEIKASVFKAIEGYIGNFSPEERDEMVHIDLDGSFGYENSITFVIDRYKCGLDKKDEDLAAELSAIMIEAAAEALENLEIKVHTRNYDLLQVYRQLQAYSQLKDPVA